MDFSEVRESFCVHYNKDYSMTAIWVKPIQKLLEEMEKLKEDGFVSERLSSNSQEEIAKPCCSQAFSTPNSKLDVIVGLTLNPLETRRRGQSSDYLLTIFYEVKSKNAELDGSISSSR